MCVALPAGAAEYTIHSGETKTLAELGAVGTGFGTLEIVSGGTLSLANNTNTGGATDTIHVSGTGNGEYSSGVPRGAIYSGVTMGQNQGIFANVVIGNEGAYATAGGSRLRFQGQVTGGTLTTYSPSWDKEVHAGAYSAFNNNKLIVAGGNFTFCGEVSGTVIDSHTHYFTNGIEVQNGAGLRLWKEKDLKLYTDGTETTPATITIQQGGKFSLEGQVDSKLNANFQVGSGASFVLGQAANLPTNVTLTGNITGTSINKTMTGTLTLTGALNTTGQNTVTAGTLRLQGSMASSVSVSNGATLDWDYSGATELTYASTISGAGTFQKSGTGTLTLQSDQTYTGSTVVKAGILRLKGSLASPTVTVNGTGVLDWDYSGAAALAYAGTIGGEGTFRKSGTGALSVAANADTLAVELNAGRLTLGAGETVKALTLSGGTLDLAGSAPTRLDVTGDLTVREDAALVVNLNETGSDLYAVGGDLVFEDGAKILFEWTGTRPVGESVTPGQSFEFMTVAGNGDLGDFQAFLSGDLARYFLPSSENGHFALDVNGVAVPEPASVWMLLAGVVFGGVMARRKRR